MGLLNKMRDFKKILYSRKILLLIFILYLILVYHYRSYVGMWDAWNITNAWFLSALKAPFYILNYDDAGHPSFGYFLLLAIPQYFSPGNTSLLHFTNAFLTILSSVAFYGVLRTIFQTKKQQFNFIILTAFYLFFPINLASMLHQNTDYGVLIFFLISFYFILKEKLLLASLSGIFLVFSKEPGIVLYILLLTNHFLFHLIGKKVSKNHLLSVKSFVLVFLIAIPILLFVIRLFTLHFILGKPVFWLGTNFDWPATWVGWKGNRIWISYLVAIFILNFNWILTFFTIIGLVLYFFFLIIKKKTKTDNFKQKSIIFSVLLFFEILFVLTRYKTYSNVRYFLPLYPLLIIFFYVGLTNLFSNFLVRRTILLITFFIFFVANFYTFDPVSKKIYGTFTFGKHEILKMTSITGECCGFGRDQLVYNLQFTNFHFLLDKISQDIYREGKMPFVINDPLIGMDVNARIDVNTAHRTLRYQNAFTAVNVTFWWGLMNAKPYQMYYIEFPNVPVLGIKPPWLLAIYDITNEKIYDYNGYQIKVYELTMKK